MVEGKLYVGISSFYDMNFLLPESSNLLAMNMQQGCIESLKRRQEGMYLESFVNGKILIDSVNRRLPLIFVTYIPCMHYAAITEIVYQVTMFEFCLHCSSVCCMFSGDV